MEQYAAGSRRAGSSQQAAGRRTTDNMHRAPGSEKSIIRYLLSYCSLPAARCPLFSRLLPAACCLLFCGCRGPSSANIELRKENQTLADQRDQLIRQHADDLATIQASEGKNGIRPAISIDKLDKLFTAHSLSLGRLTGGYQPSGSSFDSGLVVYAVPTDDDGDPIKAAGSFKVSAFDLQEPDHPLIGQWSFDLDQSRKLFYDHFSLYAYVLQLPWQTLPRHPEVTIHVTFIDELTGREFTTQRVVKANPPPASVTATITAP
jgi:hypothetical protein